ncbi:MAG: ABC transporter ATP-binding protein [Deltaproteobacteria bacterium]|nr:ABC transporter ATP-binding protein [Deltaproteobacteria bacterium]
MLVVESVSKWFNDFQALDSVSFEVNRGEILGFLGPNGAGKSTTLKIITTFLTPSSGDVRVNGYSILKQPEQVRESVGYLPEQSPLYPELRVIEQLQFAAGLRGLHGIEKKRAIEEAIESCSLSEVLNKLCGVLSKGFRQRVGLAQAIISKPDLLILDEPTSGLDPIQILQIRELIKKLAASRAVVLSTHIMQEVQAVCTRVVVINRGKIVFGRELKELDRPLEEVFVKVIAGSENV